MVERAGTAAKLAFKTHSHMRGMPAATIRRPCRFTSGIATSGTRCAMPSCRRRGSKISGSTEPENIVSVIDLAGVLSRTVVGYGSTLPSGSLTAPNRIASFRAKIKWSAHPSGTPALRMPS
jgi:hypothetical protein